MSERAEQSKKPGQAEEIDAVRVEAERRAASDTIIQAKYTPLPDISEALRKTYDERVVEAMTSKSLADQIKELNEVAVQRRAREEAAERADFAAHVQADRQDTVARAELQKFRIPTVTYAQAARGKQARAEAVRVMQARMEADSLRAEAKARAEREIK
jgi:SepF-like predicted cell division protein (DUF552 family)